MSDNLPIQIPNVDTSILTPDTFSPTNASKFLPRLDIAHSTSDIVTGGKAKFGDYVFDGRSLGAEIPALIFHSRNRATLFQSGEVVAESFVHGSDTFKRIEATPKDNETDPQTGLEFLIYLLEEGAFATLFLSKSRARKTAQFFNSSPHRLDGKPGARYITTERVEWKNFKWFVPEVGSAIAELDSSWIHPTQEVIERAYALFTSPAERPFPESPNTTRER